MIWNKYASLLISAIRISQLSGHYKPEHKSLSWKRKHIFGDVFLRKSGWIPAKLLQMISQTLKKVTK